MWWVNSLDMWCDSPSLIIPNTLARTIAGGSVTLLGAWRSVNMANLGAGRAKDPLLKANDLLPGLFIMSDSRALPRASSANVAFWLSVCLCSIFD